MRLGECLLVCVCVGETMVRTRFANTPPANQKLFLASNHETRKGDEGSDTRVRG